MNVTNQVETISQTNTERGGLILFDGVCGLCNKFVQHVLKGDPTVEGGSKGHFVFASLQSNLAKEVLARHGKDSVSLKSVYLIKNLDSDNEKLYCKSEAALRVMAELSDWTKNLKFFLFVPTPLRDIGYDLVATVRYQIFGKHDSCPLPDPKDRDRFLDL